MTITPSKLAELRALALMPPCECCPDSEEDPVAVEREDLLALLDQLAAVTAARDEACHIADGVCEVSDAAPVNRIAELRKVGAL